MNFNLKLLLLFTLLYFFVSCNNTQTEEISFVKNGKIQWLKINGLEEKTEGYLEAGGSFSLSNDKAVYGNEIDVTLKLSFTYDDGDRDSKDNQAVKSIAGTEWVIYGFKEDTVKYIYRFLKNGVFWVAGGQAGEGDDGLYKQEGSRVFLRIGEFKWEGYYDGTQFTLIDTQTRFRIDVGDNVLSISNAENEDAESGEMKFFLYGPSIGRREQLGLVSDKIMSGNPFELSISYKNNKLVYAIDGREIYTRQTDIPPAGLIKMNGFSKGLHIYDVMSKGQFKPFKELVTREFMLDRATKSVMAAAEKVKGDPNRPAYHFQPPANWNNDPNGMLYYNGYYHMFYQHNPYADVWDWMHWGHTRSKDLVHWEHLPIALWPSVEKGEKHCFSGSGFTTKDSKPILFYTSIGHELPEHWAAIPADNDLIVWDKHPQNPLIVMEDHGGEMIDSWRDPFLFREDGESYMVIGGHPRGKKGSIMMYKALNEDLTKWQFLGSPFEGEEGNWECPNFFKVEDKYVLIYSPHAQVEYYVGELDLKNIKFQKEYHGIIDNCENWNYYAPNTLQMEDGRRLLFGWINNFKLDQGWQGAITLPRELSLDDKGRLVQKPVKELSVLRGNHTQYENVNLANADQKIDVNIPQFEIIADLNANSAEKIGFRFNDENGKSFELNLTPNGLNYSDGKVVFERALEEKIKNVHLFFDRTVIEIFINGGRQCATKVVYPDLNNLNFEIFSDDQETTISKLDVWELKSIW